MYSDELVVQDTDWKGVKISILQHTRDLACWGLGLLGFELDGVGAAAAAVVVVLLRFCWFLFLLLVLFLLLLNSSEVT